MQQLLDSPEMIEDTVRHTLQGMDYKKYCVDRMVTATEHIRDCERCRRVYGAAFEAMKEESGAYVMSPWNVYFQCSRELHGCEHWPKGI